MNPEKSRRTEPSGRLRNQEVFYKKNILEAIGDTPLVQLNPVVSGLPDRLVLAKAEFFNPAGSIKDRIGIHIIEDAEKKGLLKPGGTIVEATSGNTGAGLALAAAVKGYHCIFVMPDKMSDEKVRFLRAFGARVVIAPTAVGPEDPRSYYSVARRIVSETPNSLLANQYFNPANPDAHYRSTGPEIWTQTHGKIDFLVLGLGTGGTLSGIGKYLREMNPNIKIVGVDVVGSLLYDTWKLGRIPDQPYLKTYKIEGIGEDFVPGTMDLGLLDEVVQVDDRESFLMTRSLVKEEGLFCGGSSGSAVAGLLKSRLVKESTPGQVIVVILPDSGNRYLSKIFDDTWMRENGFFVSQRSEETVDQVLNSRDPIRLVTAHPEDRLTEVVARMKHDDISQVPVVDAEGRLVGMITELDLLEHLMNAGHIHDPEETIADIYTPNVITVPPTEKVDNLMPWFERGKVIAVVKNNKPVGMITKIDVIDYLTRQI
jgi:cystathionine beta-synthase